MKIMSRSYRIKSPAAIACAALLGWTASLAGHGQTRTLRREADPVILRAWRSAAIANQPISGYRVYAVHNGKVNPIPFQIDERTPKNRLVLTNGPEANVRDADGLFNRLDDLVFMARDLGDRAKPGSLPSGWKLAAEIQVQDPVDQSQAWAYLLYFDHHPPPLSAADYVSIDPQTSHITARNYSVGFSPPAPMVLGELVITPAGGGDNVDYCDRLKVRASARLWDLVDIRKTEEDFTSVMVAWKDGPVRVIRRTRSRVILFWNLPSPAAVFDNYYYYNWFSFPTSITLPFPAHKIISQGTIRVSMDSPRLSGQRRYRNSNWPEGVIQDGVMSEAEKQLAQDPRPFLWSSTGTVGPDGKDYGVWLNRLKVMTDNPGLDLRVYYVDDKNHLDPPDEEPGSYGNAGYQVTNLQGLPAGEYELLSVMFNVPVFSPELVPLYLNLMDQPLAVRLSPWPP